MHYSNIEDVWGSNNKNEHMQDLKTIEPTIQQSTIQQPTIQQQPTMDLELTETTIDENECKILINKIMKSKKCKRYLRNKFRPKILEKLEDIIDEYREVIVLILICYAIYLFVSIINDA